MRLDQSNLEFDELKKKLVQKEGELESVKQKYEILNTSLLYACNRLKFSPEFKELQNQFDQKEREHTQSLGYLLKMTVDNQELKNENFQLKQENERLKKEVLNFQKNLIRKHLLYICRNI